MAKREFITNNRFNFVIAKPWKKGEKELNVYMIYNCQVHYGDIEYAEDLREKVLIDSKENNYNIYPIIL